MAGINLGTIYAEIELHTKGLRAGVQTAKAEILHGTGQIARTVTSQNAMMARSVQAVGKASMAAGAAILTGYGLAARESIAFERSMRNVKQDKQCPANYLGNHITFVADNFYFSLFAR